MSVVTKITRVHHRMRARRRVLLPVVLIPSQKRSAVSSSNATSVRFGSMEAALASKKSLLRISPTSASFVDLRCTNWQQARKGESSIPFNTLRSIVSVLVEWLLGALAPSSSCRGLCGIGSSCLSQHQRQTRAVEAPHGSLSLTSLPCAGNASHVTSQSPNRSDRRARTENRPSRRRPTPDPRKRRRPRRQRMLSRSVVRQ